MTETNQSIEPNCCITTLQVWNPFNENSIWRKKHFKAFGIFFITCLSIILVIGISINFGSFLIKNNNYDFKTGYKEEYKEVCMNYEGKESCIKKLCSKYKESCTSDSLFSCFIHGATSISIYIFALIGPFMLLWSAYLVSKRIIEGFRTNRQVKFDCYFWENFSLKYCIILVSLVVLFSPASLFSSLVYPWSIDYDVNTGFKNQNIGLCKNFNITDKNLCYYEKECRREYGLDNFIFLPLCYLLGTVIFYSLLILLIILIGGSFYIGHCICNNYSESFQETKKAIIKKVTGYESYSVSNDNDMVELEEGLYDELDNSN